MFDFKSCNQITIQCKFILNTRGPHHNLAAADPRGPRGLVVERAQAFGEDERGVVVSVEHGVDEVQRGLARVAVLVQCAVGVEAAETEGVERMQGAHEAADLLLAVAPGAQAEAGVGEHARVRVQVVPDVREGVRAHSDAAVELAVGVGEQLGGAQVVLEGVEGRVGRRQVVEARDVVPPVERALHVEGGRGRGHEDDARVRRALQGEVGAHHDRDPRRVGAEPRVAGGGRAQVREAVVVDGRRDQQAVGHEELAQDPRHAVVVAEHARVDGLDAQFLLVLHGLGQERQHAERGGVGVEQVDHDFVEDRGRLCGRHGRSV